MSSNTAFTKDNLDYYLKELAKEYRKRNSKSMPAEIILIGGASILANYGFRDVTYDIDAIISAGYAMKESINAISDKLNLPTGWMNTDFKYTASYSDKLVQFSDYYKTYSNILTIRTVKAEYLIAMKLISGRQYKKDLSDIVGILIEQQNAGHAINYNDIDHAMKTLYGGWDNADSDAVSLLNKALSADNLLEIFEAVKDEELAVRESLLDINEKYPNIIKAENIKELILMAKNKQKLSIHDRLAEKKAELKSNHNASINNERSDKELD